MTFDELQHVTRKKLKLSKSALPEAVLEGLWLRLDADDSDAIDTSEFARFLRGDIAEMLAAGRERRKPPPGIAGRRLQLRSPSKKVERPPFDLDE